MKKPKILVLGLDGATLDLIREFARRGTMPFFAGLLNNSAVGELDSTMPPTTLPAWTSFMTGTPPSSHGVADFTVKDGYRVRFVGAGDRRLPTWFSHLETRGLTVGAAWFPATYPPEQLRGYHIAGWDSPVTSSADASFVHPPALHSQMRRHFGPHHLFFDVIDEFSDSDDWYDNAVESLCSSVEQRTEMALWLLENHPTDVAAFYFGQSDTVAHHFWAHHDPGSPRRPGQVSESSSRAIEKVYAQLDIATKTLVEQCGAQTSLVLLSDHGSGGSSDWAVHLNRFLEQKGLLAFKRPRAARSLLGAARGTLVGIVPPRFRRGLFRAAGGILPSVAESTLRFGGIDWDATLAFSEEINYAPGIWLNQLGREPKGLVRHDERAALCDKIAQELLGLKTPDGVRLVKRVIRREEIHEGPLVALFPDLILEMNLVDGYTPCVLPSRGRPGNPVSRLSGDALLGRKGRSMPGCHTQKGILLVAGSRTEALVIKGASIHDVPGIICSLAGVPPASWFECNQVLGFEASAATENETYGKRAPAVFNRRPTLYTRGEEKTVAKRLKRLGYLED